MEGEDLDPLMNGQTHRAHLSELVKESGGQGYAKADSGGRIVKSGSIFHGPKSAGRGGGIAGTRGRGTPYSTSG